VTYVILRLIALVILVKTIAVVLADVLAIRAITPCVFLLGVIRKQIVLATLVIPIQVVVDVHVTAVMSTGVKQKVHVLVTQEIISSRANAISVIHKHLVLATLVIPNNLVVAFLVLVMHITLVVALEIQGVHVTVTILVLV
jgi:hypothetical protein